MKTVILDMMHMARPQMFILTAIIFLAGCKSTEVPCSWTERTVHIDGASDDWQDYPLTFFEEEQVSIGISNDSSNVYVVLRTNNPMLIGSIRRSGITLWLDTDGGKDNDRGIQYIGGPSPEEMEEAGIRIRPQGLDQRNMHTPMNTMPDDTTPETRLTFIDHSQGFEEIVFLRDGDGPEIAYGFENGLCVYELKVPFVDEDAGIFGIAAEPGQAIEICAEYGASRMESPPRSMGGGPGGMSGGGHPGGGGMRPGGGMRGGPPGQGGEDREIWMKTRLAAPER